MNIGNITVSSSAASTSTGLVWKEKSRWFNSLCSNKLMFDKNHRIGAYPTFNAPVVTESGPWDTYTSDASWCRVIVEPIEND
jgi:hypothetical protein